MKSQPTIRITEQELYELSKGAIDHSMYFKSQMQFDSKLRHEVARHFRLVSSMARPSKISRQGSTIFLVAGLSFLFLAVKIFCETFWRIH